MFQSTTATCPRVILSFGPNLPSASDGTTLTFDAWLDGVIGAGNDPEMHELAWETLSAAACPHLSTERALFLVSDEDMRGRRAFCGLLDSIIGPDVAHLSLDQLTRKRTPSEIVGKAAIVSSVPDSAPRMERTGAFKCMVTNEPFCLNRPYKDPVTFRVNLFLAFCVDDLSQLEDRTGSFTRRILTIPFETGVSDACDARALEEWLSRDDVLEYLYSKAVTWHWADGDGHYVVPESCLSMLASAMAA